MYEVRREDHVGNSRLLHRNLLYPCDFLAPAPQPQLHQTRPAERRQRRRLRNRQEQQHSAGESDESDSSDSDIGWTPADLQQNDTVHGSDTAEPQTAVDTVPDADIEIDGDVESDSIQPEEVHQELSEASEDSAETETQETPEQPTHLSTLQSCAWAAETVTIMRAVDKLTSPAVPGCFSATGLH